MDADALAGEALSVDHDVSLIQHEHGDLCQVQNALFEAPVQRGARCSNDDLLLQHCALQNCKGEKGIWLPPGTELSGALCSPLACSDSGCSVMPSRGHHDTSLQPWGAGTTPIWEKGVCKSAMVEKPPQQESGTDTTLLPVMEVWAVPLRGDPCAPSPFLEQCQWLCQAGLTSVSPDSVVHLDVSAELPNGPHHLPDLQSQLVGGSQAEALAGEQRKELSGVGWGTLVGQGQREEHRSIPQH